MSAHLVSGGWYDVTAACRNEIVFEGRNKEYGAYSLRVNYSRALLMAMLATTSVAVLCGTAPVLMRKLWAGAAPAAAAHYVSSHLLVYKEKIKTPVCPPPPKPPVSEAKTIKNPPPVIAKTVAADSVPAVVSKMVIGGVTGKGGPDTALIGKTGGIGIVPVIPDNTPPAPIPTIVEKMPKFKGDLQKYFSDNIVYPDYEKSVHLGGTVYVSFVVENDGTISGVQLLHGVAGAPDLAGEALRVVSAMPAWLPGEQSGHKVKVRLNLPVKFSVQ
ncbi:MAG: TonB family protein [Bacteroidia bacterium]|nr:TonB family protein [Bacteroidia bacterium]